MRRASLLLLLTLGLLSISLPAHADAPYSTWTLGPGHYFLPVQDAYTPLNQIDLPVDAPEDMAVGPDGFLYVADTGNSRILKLSPTFEIVGEFGADHLQSPTGIHVDAAGRMFIADAGRNMIVILDENGELVHEFGRPDEPLYGASREFLPRKIDMDARGNLYIVSEGSVNGLVTMTPEGDFIGYFGANPADMSLMMILQRLFLTPEQLDQFIRSEAASPTNLAIDSQSLVYTVTAGTNDSQSIRKFTVSGRNLMGNIFGTNDFRDIHVSDEGLMTAIDAQGHIVEYDLDGTLLFFFGGQDEGYQRLGLLNDPVAVERVSEQLYVLDKAKNAIVTYQVTDFGRTVHEGVRLYMQGFYEDAKPYFEDTLNYNGLVLMAYQGLADAEYDERNNADALYFYRYADDRAGYSEAFWELRNSVLQRYLGTALVGIVVGWSALSVFGRMERRRGWLNPFRRWVNGLRRFRLIDDFAFLFRFIRHPADSFYYIKTGERGSLLFAFILFGWVIVLRILAPYLTSFIFNPISTPWDINIGNDVAYTVIPLALWIISNYLISTISDGEGSLKQVIIGTAYSLFPYALLMLPIMLISNVLTFNESFLYTFANQGVTVWCGIMLVIMVKEIHNYTFGETVRNILLTLFTMAILLLTAYILYVLFTQLFEFVQAIVQESALRA